MKISVWAHLCLIALLAAFQLPLTLVSMFPGSSHLSSVCVLCCSVPRCPVTIYCVELNTQQNLLLSERALLLSSMVLLSCALSWHSIYIFLTLEESVRVGKDFESTYCKKGIGKRRAGRYPQWTDHYNVSSELLEPEDHLQKRRISGSLTVTISLVIRKAMWACWNKYWLLWWRGAWRPLFLSFRCMRDRLQCTHLLWHWYMPNPGRATSVWIRRFITTVRRKWCYC